MCSKWSRSQLSMGKHSTMQHQCAAWNHDQCEYYASKRSHYCAAVFQLSAVADTPFIRLARDGTTSTGEFVAPHARHRFIELLHTS